MTTTFLVVNGDVVINEASGAPVLVSDDLKLRQDLKESLSTEVRPDNIGAGLDALVGSNNDIFVLRADIAARVRSSIGRMQDLQTRFHRNERPANERIARLARVDVFNLESLTAFAFRVEVVTVQGVRLPVTGTIA